MITITNNLSILLLLLPKVIKLQLEMKIKLQLTEMSLSPTLRMLFLSVGPPSFIRETNIDWEVEEEEEELVKVWDCKVDVEGGGS